jgi:hypothetical protein
MTNTWLCSLAVFIYSLAFFSSVCFAAETAPNAELEGILQKIESRHYRWIAIRADVLFFFAKANDSNTMCGGELLYQRLDERMMLVCADQQKNLAFVFRTFDRNFDLYLPSRNTVYHGSIFDMEDSPDIESHLKARDLYRALKPLAVDAGRARIERNNSLVTSLDVYGQRESEDKLVRKLYLTPEGDVRGELFYNAEGRPLTEIQRYDFRKLRGHAGAYDSFIFPKKITITSPETKKGSAIFFTKVAALDTIDPLEFILRVPPGTQEVFLDKKDLGSRDSKATPAVKAIPVYLAKPLNQAAKKMRTAPAKKETETGKAPAPEGAAAAAVLENKSATTTAEPAPSPVSPSPASDAQTTLDPSVDPSLEMGKP